MIEYDDISKKAFDLILENVATFNTWRLTNLTTTLNFNERNFLGKEYPGALLVNIDLSHSNFEDTLLDGAIFCSSNLEEADFLNTQVCKVIFGVPDLINTSLDKQLQRFMLKAANLTNAKFGSADLTGSTFREANIKGADFRFTSLDYVDFRRTNYKEACFKKAYLAQTLFDGENPDTN